MSDKPPPRYSGPADYTSPLGDEIRALRERLAAVEKERDAAVRDAELLAEKVCDECNGSGEYFIDDEVRVCICVGDTEPYQRIERDRDALKRELAELRELFDADTLEWFRRALLSLAAVENALRAVTPAPTEPEQGGETRIAEEAVTEIPTAYEMGVDFIERDELPDSIPLMHKPVEGWSIYSDCEGESPTFEGFFVDREIAEALCNERYAEGALVLFDAFVFDAILLPEGLVTSNDCDMDTHEKLAGRIEQWRARGWTGTS